MHHQHPRTISAVEQKTAAPDAKLTRPADALAEQLWAEHGWNLTGRDLTGLLIAVLIMSIFLG
jgi:hypothetical protein